MAGPEDTQNFTETHHAHLFALIAREVIRRVGEEQGTKLVRTAVRKYGEQRGRRMALRAQRDGQALTMENYLVYGEWKSAGARPPQQELTAQEQGFHLQVFHCPWAAAWKESGLNRYGQLYCLEIDPALVRGFNPSLTIQVNETLTIQGNVSDFFFQQKSDRPAEALAGIQRHSAELGERARMPWEYHCGHLYAAMLGVLVEALGPAGAGAVEAGLDAFQQQYSPEMAAAIRRYKKMDFDRLPGEQNPIP